MHPSKTLYWIYAITKKTFGNQIDITRDSLGKRYAVNKYSVKLTPRDNTKSADVEQSITQVILKAGFVGDGSFYTKNWGKNKTIIHFSSNDRGVSVSIHSYGV